MRKRILAPITMLLLLTACGAADDGADSGPAERSGTGATVTVVDGALGAFLADGAGMTLYLFTADGPGTSSCTGGCLTVWPPLLTDGDPVGVGAAAAALLGTLVRDDGTIQVTYADQPLYLFAGDMSAGDVNGQGVDGAWFVVAPDGSMITGGDGTAPPSGGMGGPSPAPSPAPAESDADSDYRY